ncbi:hypothetical protein O181_000932 [Austropuccinia psidii MF-1]|uniref:Exocyst complex component Sec8 n=1 Tax=Austropuccinia psidii MF-1 TaxID=1389203 RepID=A0A9Q3GCJ0_9BASI|nr:hypothetical protein [Austropuccinia psidii MF-1]
MSRTRDLRPNQPQNHSQPSIFQSNSTEPQPRRPSNDLVNFNNAAHSSPHLPPSRPQRSAARQPGIIVTNGSLNNPDDFYHSPLSSQSNSLQKSPEFQAQSSQINHQPIKRNNKLFQAITAHQDIQRQSPSNSNNNPNRNGYLNQDYRARQDISQSSSHDSQIDRIHQRSVSSSSNGSFDHHAKTDLLSPDELRDAKRLYGARNVIEAFSTQTVKQASLDRLKTRPHRAASNLNPQNSINQNHQLDQVPTMLNNQSYPLTPGFQEIERVLEKIKLNWDHTGIAGPNHDHHPSSHFTPVGLALELLDNENSNQSESKRSTDLIDQKEKSIPSLSSFLKLKAELEKALQLTIQASYRQFDASLTSYNLVKASVDQSYKKVSDLKAKLFECRLTLGTATPTSTFNNNSTSSKGTEMKILQTKREMLQEMLKLINTIDKLKQVPERLERLITSKSFLSATVLLVRSLKVINNPQLSEISGLSDLRSYLVNQESVLFEILIEELQNHLYLKTHFCDNKWSAYHKGQVTLPILQSLNQAKLDPFEPPFHQKKSLNKSKTWNLSHLSLNRNTTQLNQSHLTTSRLQEFLNNLLTKPQSNPLVDQADVFLELGSSEIHQSINDQNESDIRISLTNSGTLASKKLRNQITNPELDSFGYIESLIESLVVLRKISLGLDTILQRVPIEIYALVENTSNQVDERHEGAKRTFGVSSTSRCSLKRSLTMVNLLISTGQSQLPGTSPLNFATGSQASHLFSGFKINGNEIKELESIAHIIQDFFWTLYSKLDATLQSFRVLYEVSLRISERKDFKEDGIKPNLVLFSLLEVWKPIQSELLALIHAYLTESSSDQFSATEGIQAQARNHPSTITTRRNPMSSIAEVLKINISGGFASSNSNMPWKDSNKQLFKFKDSELKSSLKDLRLHESNLDSALRISVPGLVLNSKGVGGALLVTGLRNDDNSTGRAIGPHRLLVKSDAFHFDLLLKPTLEFLKRAKDVLPTGVMMGLNDEPSREMTEDTGLNDTELNLVENSSSGWNHDSGKKLTQFGGFSDFLDEFVLHSFLPQLEERIICIFEYFINAPDAFQNTTIEPSTNSALTATVSLRQMSVWHVPVAKSLTALLALVERICEMLHSTPFHQEKHGALLVSLVVQYYQKCYGRFKEIVVRESSETTLTVDENAPHANLKLAADWAQKPELFQCLQGLLSHSTLDDHTLKKLSKKCCKIEQQALKSRVLSSADLIQSSKKLTALAHLHSTMKCLIAFIRCLGSTVKVMPSSEDEELINGSLDQDLTSQFEPPVERHGIALGFRLPLTSTILRRFLLVHRSLSNLAQTILFTLHLELRLQAYHYINLTFKDGTYFLNSSDSTEPEPKIVELNSLINSSENSINESLNQSEKQFIFNGLVNLMNELMIDQIIKLKIGNELGFKKIYRNVVSLEQNMKSLINRNFFDHHNQSRKENLISESKSELSYGDFEKSRKFWEMGSNGHQAIMQSIRNGPVYSFEQYKKLLELTCNINGHSNLMYEKLTNAKLRPQHVPSIDHRNSIDGNLEKKKRIFNECLIELHASVIEEDEDEDS